MTAVQLIWFASLAGALLFFAAGAITMVLRQRGAGGSLQGHAEALEAAHLQVIQQRDAATAELARLHVAERARTDELARLRHALERSEAAELEERSTIVKPVREAELAQQRAEAAEREAAALRTRAEREAAALRTRTEREAAALRDRAEREAAALRDRAEAAAQDAGALRARIDAAEAELAPLRRSEQQLRAELERARAEVVAAHATIEQLRAPADRSKQLAGDLERVQRELAAAKATVDELRASAERERQRAGELERVRTEATALRGELEQLEARLREAEQQLAERGQTVRDLSAESEQLKGRLRDAEMLRGEYVRLRTAATETAFLKSEVERLEGELRALKIEALGGKPRRPARGSGRALTQPHRSIGESLSTVIERFTETSTRSVAIADPAGFPLASSGDDGQALAAYASLLLDAASRAGQFLPVTAPSTVEIVDHAGARISVWAFEVDSERLLLANLAVAPAEPARVETALADLTAILAPSALAKTTAT